jgi:hypothetical protein
MLGIIGVGTPDMNLEHTHLHKGDEASRILDHEVGLFIAWKLHGLDEGRKGLGAVTLEETRLAFAGRAAHQADRPSLDLGKHQRGDFFVVVGEVALGDGRARIKLLVRMSECHLVGGLGRLAAGCRRFLHRGRFLFLANDLGGRFVFAYPLEGGMAHHAILRPFREIHMGDQLGLGEDRTTTREAGDRLERRLLLLQGLQLLQESVPFAVRKPGTDLAGEDEFTFVVVAHEQGAKSPRMLGLCRIAPDDEFLFFDALGFDPALTTTGVIGIVGPLRDDALQ